jgi:hypothetical protein
VAFGELSAIAAAAIPKVNRADVIKVPDLFMGSPAVILTSATKNTPDQLPGFWFLGASPDRVTIASIENLTCNIKQYAEFATA